MSFDLAEWEARFAAVGGSVSADVPGTRVPEPATEVTAAAVAPRVLPGDRRHSARWLRHQCVCRHQRAGHSPAGRRECLCCACASFDRGAPAWWMVAVSVVSTVVWAVVIWWARR